MAMVFGETEGILLRDCLEEGKTINRVTAAMYWDLIKRSCGKNQNLVTREVVPGVLFHQANAPAHTSSVAMASIHQCGLNTLDQPPNSPDWSPSHYYPFPKLKSEKAIGSNVLLKREIMLRNKVLIKLQVSVFIGRPKNYWPLVYSVKC